MSPKNIINSALLKLVHSWTKLKYLLVDNIFGFVTIVKKGIIDKIPTKSYKPENDCKIVTKITFFLSLESNIFQTSFKLNFILVLN